MVNNASLRSPWTGTQHEGGQEHIARFYPRSTRLESRHDPLRPIGDAARHRAYTDGVNSRGAASGAAEILLQSRNSRFPYCSHKTAGSDFRLQLPLLLYTTLSIYLSWSPAYCIAVLHPYFSEHMLVTHSESTLSCSIECQLAPASIYAFEGLVS